MSRKIQVFSSLRGSDLVTLENVEANTWGELQPILRQHNLLSGDMKAVVREIQSSFESDSSPLPQGLGEGGDHDFTLFLSPNKTKSGLK